MPLSKFQKSLRVPVEAAALLLTLVSLESAASAGSSWQSQPAWAATSEKSTPRKGAYAKELRNGGVAPFSPSSNNIALDLGQVFLMGDLNSRYSDSIGTQLHYTYGVSDLFGFDTSIGYSEHSEGKMSMATILTGVRTNLAWYDKVVPYVVFGLGFYKPSYQTTSGPNGSGAVTTISPLLFGIHLGPGVDLELTRNLFFGAALTFHDVFGPTKTTANNQNIDVGGTYTSFLLHAGVTF